MNSTPPGIPINTPPKYVKSMMDLSNSSPGNDEIMQKAPRKSSLEIATEQTEQKHEESLPAIPEEKEKDTDQTLKQGPEKIKTWPVFQGGRVQAENDKMFRDIIFSPNLKERKVVPLPPTRKSDKSKKEEANQDESEANNILLEKMLDN